MSSPATAMFLRWRAAGERARVLQQQAQQAISDAQDQQSRFLGAVEAAGFDTWAWDDATKQVILSLTSASTAAFAKHGPGKRKRA